MRAQASHFLAKIRRAMERRHAVRELPADLPMGMLGLKESLLCYQLARDEFRGKGTIVDAGSFAGKSAYCFARGLEANPRYAPARHRIHCFDNFLVNESPTVEFIRKHFHRTVFIGDSTRRLFDSQVASVRHMLEVHEGDFHTVDWRPEPIEILFVDIAKSTELHSRVAELFYANLIPGRSLVMHQDYHHPWLPHIHVSMEYLSRYFETVVSRVDDSALFRCRAAIPHDVLRRVAEYDFSPQEQLALIDRAIERLPEDDRFYVELARIVLRLILDGSAGPAVRPELDRLERRFQERDRGYSGNGYFEDVRSAIDEYEAWDSLKAQRFEHCLRLSDRVLLRWASSWTMTLRGRALLGLERYAEAEQQLRAAVASRPAAGPAYIDLASALRAQGRAGEAEEQLLQGLRDPHCTDATPAAFLDALAGFWDRDERLPEREATLAALLAEFADVPEVWILAARLAWLKGQADETGKALERAAAVGLPAERLEQARRDMQAV